jgi:DNA ligase (NAD+)
LVKLEIETGIVLSNSPTQRVQGQILDGFNKVVHSKPMLSAQKTKDINDIKKWAGKRCCYCSYKLDGLTLILRYSGGKLTQAITRGDGVRGEDVTEQARMITNIPLQIPYKHDLEVRGECVVSWENFKKINENLSEPFSHPRNMSAGTLRNLNTELVRERKLSFVVFENITVEDIDSKTEILMCLAQMGFEVVPFAFGEDADLEEYVEIMKPEGCQYPVDGLIFELDSVSESEKTESTAHHEGCRYALKWQDETYSTILEDIEWNTSRSGLVAPVAIFKEVDLDGAKTTRATLHNVSIIEKLQLGIGDELTIYRSNMVIPAIDENLTKSNTYKLPTTCPTCGHTLELRTSDTGTKNLYCNNPNCQAQLVGKLTHFVSKHAMNIQGVSESIIETLVDNGYVECYSDIYTLEEYKDTLIKTDGFGEKSYENLMKSINESRNTTLERFIVAMGIPNIGRSAAKTVAKHFKGDLSAFVRETVAGFDYTTLDDFGQVAHDSIYKWLMNFSKKDLVALSQVLTFNTDEYQEQNIADNPFNGKNVAVTGKLTQFTRDSINAKLESLGAKPASGVTLKTDYLINNDSTSQSSKNKKANELNIPIITEAEFLKMIGE